jgi:hypothetical protein
MEGCDLGRVEIYQQKPLLRRFVAPDKLNPTLGAKEVTGEELGDRSVSLASLRDLRDRYPQCTPVDSQDCITATAGARFDANQGASLVSFDFEQGGVSPGCLQAVLLRRSK